MPTQYLYRSWCVPCGDWTLFYHQIGEDTAKCKVCSTAHEAIKLKDIPEEKLKEQRERYKIYKKEKDAERISSLLGGSFLFSGRGTIGGGMMDQLDEMMSEDFPEPIIVESDAGQKKLDEIEDHKRKVELYNQQVKREEERKEAQKYRHLGRNDICLCGSGNKYKKCCMNKIKQLL